MRARVKQNGKGKFIIQYKATLFGFELWWKNHGLYQADYNGGSYFSTSVYDNEQKATEDMIKLVLKHERIDNMAKQTEVVAEVTTEEVREKFSEFFI